MSLIQNHDDSNWFRALSLWSRVVNWSHYGQTKTELETELISLIVFLWSEKDWLKKQHLGKAREIESYINTSRYIKVIGDLANTAKHKELDQSPRSRAEQTNYYGRIVLGNGKERRLHYVRMDDGEHLDIISILRGAIHELEILRDRLAG